MSGLCRVRRLGRTLTPLHKALSLSLSLSLSHATLSLSLTAHRLAQPSHLLMLTSTLAQCRRA